MPEMENLPEGENAVVNTPTPEQVAIQQAMDYAFNTEPPAVPVAEVIAESIVTDPPIDTYDYTPFIKENFGVDTVDEAKALWTSLQELKANPPKAIDQEFTNEESKKLHELVRTGKFKEANDIISQQLKIEELTGGDVTDLTADEIIKLGMRFENKELTPAEIEFKFKKLFSVPKKPEQSLTEDDDDFKLRLDDWKEQADDVKMSKTIAAKEMKPKLEAAKATIQFPDILSPKQDIDQEYEAYKASNAEVSDKVKNILIPGIQSLKESDVSLNFKVEDANNQMNFDVAIAPTKEDFEKAKQDSLALDKFLQGLSYDKDGKFLPQNLQKMILLYNNFDNYAQSVARQAVNAERKRVIGKEAVNNGGGGRDFNVNTEKTEFQKQMERSLS